MASPTAIMGRVNIARPAEKAKSDRPGCGMLACPHPGRWRVRKGGIELVLCERCFTNAQRMGLKGADVLGAIL